MLLERRAVFGVDLVLERFWMRIHVIPGGLRESELGVGIDVHFENAVAHCFGNFLRARAGAAVEDEIKRPIRRAVDFLYMLLRGFEDFRPKMHIAGLVDAMHIAKRRRDREMAKRGETLVGRKNFRRLGVEFAVIDLIDIAAEDRKSTRLNSSH